MADFDFITPRIATGGALTGPSDVEAVRAAGITHVLDARAEYDDGTLFTGPDGLAYCWNPTDDDGATKPVSYWQRTLVFALPMFAQPSTRLLCHCAAGVNRGPSNAICVMLALGWRLSDAMTLLAVARPQALAHYAGDARDAVRQLGYIP
jgi:hypothetical protein